MAKRATVSAQNSLTLESEEVFIKVKDNLSAFVNGFPIMTSGSQFISSLGPFGAAPNANGSTVTAQALILQPASGTFPGGVSVLAQDFAGEKTFLSTVHQPDGVSFGNLNPRLAADELNHFQHQDSGNITFSGPFAAGNQTVVFHIERIGNMVALNFAELAAAGGGAAAAIVTTTPLPAFAFQVGTTVQRSGTFPSLSNGVFGCGVWRIQADGAVAFHPTTDDASTYSNAGGNNGWVGSQTIYYSI